MDIFLSVPQSFGSEYDDVLAGCSSTVREHFVRINWANYSELFIEGSGG